MDELKHPGAPLGRSQARHESSDLKPRAIAIFAAALVAAICMVQIVSYALFEYSAALRSKRNVAPSPLASTREPTPEPRLQVNPAKDMQEMRATEDAMLNSYGWIDPKAGIVRIPIERAMELLAKRGLPERQKIESKEQRAKSGEQREKNMEREPGAG